MNKAKISYIRETLSELFEYHKVAVPDDTLQQLAEDLTHSMDMWYEMQSYQHIGSREQHANCRSVFTPIRDDEEAEREGNRLVELAKRLLS